jgi:hypothetical protein
VIAANERGGGAATRFPLPCLPSIGAVEGVRGTEVRADFSSCFLADTTTSRSLSIFVSVCLSVFVSVCLSDRVSPVGTRDVVSWSFGRMRANFPRWSARPSPSFASATGGTMSETEGGARSTGSGDREELDDALVVARAERLDSVAAAAGRKLGGAGVGTATKTINTKYGRID